MSLTTLQNFAHRLESVVHGHLPVSEVTPSDGEIYELLSEIQAVLDSEPPQRLVETKPSMESVAFQLTLQLMATMPHSTSAECEQVAMYARRMAETLYVGQR